MIERVKAIKMNIIFPYKKKDHSPISPDAPIGIQLCSGPDEELLIAETSQPASTQQLPFSAMSVRLKHILENNHLIAGRDLLSLSFSQINRLTGMGQGTVEELRQLMEKKLACGIPARLSESEKVKLDEAAALLHPEEKVLFFSQLEQCWIMLLHHSDVKRRAELSHMQPALILRMLLREPAMKNSLDHLIQQNFSEPFEIGQITNRFSVPVAEILKNEVIPDLLKQGKLANTPEGLLSVESTLQKWIESLPEKQKQIMQERLFDGWSLERSGEKHHLTRERIRQIISKCVATAPVFWFSHLIYWFKKYDIDPEAAVILFGVTLPEARFLKNSRTNTAGLPSVYEIINDPKMSLPLYQNYLKYLHRNDLCIEGTMVERRGTSILRFLAEHHASKEAVSASELFDLYEKTLDLLEIPEDSTLRYTSARSLEGVLMRSEWMLGNHSHTFRYYDLSRIDWTAAADEMGILNYENMLISARLIFRDHSELMKRLDPLNEYELHAVLRKTEPIWNRDQKRSVTFKKSPIILFGQATYHNQLVSLIEELGPVAASELVDTYCQLYGNKKSTVIGTLLPTVSQYNDNGVYQTDLPVFTEEQCLFMQDIMNDSFHTKDWIVRQFRDQFPDADVLAVNARSMKKIGYRLYVHYALPVRFRSFEEWLEDYIQIHHRVSTDMFSDIIGVSSTMYAAIYSLRKSLQIIQTDRSEYCSFDTYRQLYPGLTENMLLDYISDSTTAATPYILFNDYFLRQSGFHHEVYDLDLPSSELDLLRKNISSQNYVFSGNGVLFGHQPLLTSSVLRFLLSENPGQTSEELVRYWQKTWDISINRYKLEEILANSGFCRQDEGWYLSKADYFDSLSMAEKAVQPASVSEEATVTESFDLKAQSILLNGPSMNDEIPQSCSIRLSETQEK